MRRCSASLFQAYSTVRQSVGGTLGGKQLASLPRLLYPSWQGRLFWRGASCVRDAWFRQNKVLLRSGKSRTTQDGIRRHIHALRRNNTCLLVVILRVFVLGREMYFILYRLLARVAVSDWDVCRPLFILDIAVALSICCIGMPHISMYLRVYTLLRTSTFHRSSRGECSSLASRFDLSLLDRFTRITGLGQHGAHVAAVPVQVPPL